MHAVYGTPPTDLVDVPAGALQLSPLIPGSAAIEALADASLDSLVMHAPRGTLERRFVLAHGLRATRPGAPLTILAAKKQGGTRLGDELRAFGCVVDETARHHFRICRLVRPDAAEGLTDAITAGAPQAAAALGLWSQPGIFSWDRIDPGSALLIEYLPPLQGRGADLGCGIGVLTRAALLQDRVEHITAIDLDRRAVDACRRNVDAARAACVWADIRSSAAAPCDLDFVLMNPPFHDGGTEDQDLGRAFIARAAQVLRPGGLCLVTANRHLPYESTLASAFAQVDRPIQAEGFKVYRAVK
jgi:16S rRNA (guanine1207-N2)-methyltransferase